MKKHILSFIIILCCGNTLGEMTNEWEFLQNHLKQLDEYFQKRKGKGAMGVAVAMEGTLPRQQAFLNLQEMMRESWPAALEYLDRIATNDTQKAILLFSSWEIPEDDFTLFLESLAEKVEQGELDWQLLKWISVPTRGSRRNFHAKNEPEIQNLMTRIQELKPTD